MEIEKAKAKSFKSKYCDKAFKKQLVKAVTANYGDPNNIDKIRG